MHNHRSFNNWIKSVLIKSKIGEYRSACPGIDISVMDLGCGKGGDLGKFNYERIRNYLGIDIAPGQLKDAIFRKLNGKIDFPMICIENRGEIDPDTFYKNIPEEMYFDVVSAQFCIHYFFETENTVRNFLDNVSRKLVKGDLKCANVFLTKDKTVKIGDLNVSKVAKRGLMHT